MLRGVAAPRGMPGGGSAQCEGEGTLRLDEMMYSGGARVGEMARGAGVKVQQPACRREGVVALKGSAPRAGEALVRGKGGVRGQRCGKEYQQRFNCVQKVRNPCLHALAPSGLL